MRELPPGTENRFTEEEAALFKAGKCGHLTEYGMHPGRVVFCEEPAANRKVERLVNSTLFCATHAIENHLNYGEVKS